MYKLDKTQMREQNQAQMGRAIAYAPETNSQISFRIT